MNSPSLLYLQQACCISPILNEKESVALEPPKCSFCLQVGLPSSREQYIHRVGRTARAGKKGEAMLLLQDFEQVFLRNLKGLPVKELKSLNAQVSPA